MARYGKRIDGRAAGVSREDIIDLSASMNLLGTPQEVLRTIRACFITSSTTRAPIRPNSETSSRQLSNLDPSVILYGNGCTELIYLLPRAMPLPRVSIAQPTFNEYERACTMAKEVP